MIINTILAVIGGATILLNIVAPLTKNKKDDKVLKFLKLILSKVSLNIENGESVLKIKITGKK